MKHAANALFHAIKDQVRMVRYSIREEAETPGSIIPKSVRDEIAPLVAIGSMFGTPALRIADGIFTQVESLATEVLLPARGVDPLFPCPVAVLFQKEHRFSERLYAPLKALLQSAGARKMLVSESALDAAWSQIAARHGDTMSAAPTDAPRSAEVTQRLVHACAGIACALNDAHPVRKVVFDATGPDHRYILLSPNLYCAMVIGLATAVVTIRPDVTNEGEDVLESVVSVVNARFDRFKRAVASKDPLTEVGTLFDGLLPFLP